ncbi:MAG: GTP-binding protein [Lachnospiraceae bacterium]|nr:GTP-binding protein [Lachnospiraceae bacterium]
MTKVTIVSGFLGAGKTTLIRKLLEQVFTGEKIVLIENEYGEIGIDGGFLRDAGVIINEMNSGCICCTLVGDFTVALQQVIRDYAPDRIIIEPSGVGKLSDIIAAVEKVKEYADLTITERLAVVDAKKAKVYMKNFGEFFLNQIQYASTVILSRTQLVDEAKLAEVVALIREQNAEAPLITTPWDELPADAVRHAFERSDVENLLLPLEEEDEDEHEHHHHHHHHHDGEECDDPECSCHHHHDDDDDDDDEHEHEHHHHHDHDHDDDHECCCHHHHDDDDDDDDEHHLSADEIHYHHFHDL